VPITLIGEITHSDVAFERGNKQVEGLSGWNHFT
jgi:hypothetical protein